MNKSSKEYAKAETNNLLLKAGKQNLRRTVEFQ